MASVSGDDDEAVRVIVTGFEGNGTCLVWVNGAAEPCEKFLEFERKLNKTCKRTVHCKSVFAFKENDLVVVKTESTCNETWRRAEVRCVFERSSGEVYRVFLVDYGGTVNKKPSHVLPCPPEFADYPYQARLVRLYGLYPCTVAFDLADENVPMQYTRSSEWPSRACKFVEAMISAHEEASFVQEPELPGGEVEVFGDLRLKIEGHQFSLSRELVRNNHAIYCPEDFQREFIRKEEKPIEKTTVSPPKSLPLAKSQTVKLVNSSSAAKDKRSLQEQFAAARKNMRENASSPSESASGMAGKQQEAVTSPTASTSTSKMFGYLSRISQFGKASPQDESSVAVGRPEVPPPVSKMTALIPAGFEIVHESKNAVCPRIVVKDVNLSTVPKSAPHRRSSTSSNIPVNEEISLSPRAPLEVSSKTESESEGNVSKESSSNSLLQFFNRRRASNANSSVDDSVQSDASSVPPVKEVPKNPSNLLSVLNKLKTNNGSVGGLSVTTSGGDADRRVKALGPSSPASPTSAPALPSSPPPPSPNYPADVTQKIAKESRSLLRSEMGEAPLAQNLLELKGVSRVLIHGGIAFKPWRSLSDAKFHPSVFKALDSLRVNVLHALQQYTWPAIKKRQNVIYVGRKTQGKLLSYVAPVMDLVLDAEKPEGNGPLAVIICPGYRQAYQSYTLCKKMISKDNKKAVRILMFHDSSVSVNDTVKCLNGCEVLVTTPRCFVKLVQFSTNLRRLAVLIMDHADVLLAKFLTEVEALLSEVRHVTLKRMEEGEVVQVIASCQKWIPLVEKFCLKIPANPTVLISCPLEAALYAKPHVDLQLVEERHKSKSLLDILESVAGHQKTVVFCSSPEEADFLHQLLKSSSYFALKTSDDSSEQQLESVKLVWDDSSSPHFPVLLCTDAEFLELGIRDATCLIHYSMRPTGTKSQFGARFSCLMDNYPNLFRERVAIPTVYILMDESNDHQRAGVINFMQRCGEVNDELAKIAKECSIRKELEKTTHQLCLDLQMFGDCWDPRTCPDRHLLLPELDKSNLPRSGWVKLKLLHTISGCHFAGRILEHSDVDDDFKRIPSDYVTIAMKMSARFSDPSNMMEHVAPKVGDICAVNTDISLYHRAVILRIEREEKKPAICELRLLDEGVNIIKKAHELYFLPDELQAYSPQAIDIFVCRLKPKDCDDTWSKKVVDAVESWMYMVQNDESRSTYFKGRVVLSLRGKLWVDPLEVLRKLDNVRTDVVIRSIRINLLEENLAVDNPSHVEKLYALCEQSGLQDAYPAKVPKDAKRMSGAIAKQPVPQWAHLDLDEFEETYYISGMNPRLFFIRRLYTGKSLDHLMKDIQTIAAESAQKETFFCPGRVCLALCRADNQWGRAVMKSGVEDGSVAVFFADFGDIEEVPVENIVVIPDEIIMRLPFQAIECSLAGIKAKGSSWNDEALVYLNDLCDDKSLFTKAVSSSSGELTMGKHYLIVLVDTTTEKDVIINDLLINNNMADPNEEEQKYLAKALEGPVSNVNSSLYSRFESDEEAEEDEDKRVEEEEEKRVEEPCSKEGGGENVMYINGYEIDFDKFEADDVSELLQEILNKPSDQVQNRKSIENGTASNRALPAPNPPPTLNRGRERRLSDAEMPSPAHHHTRRIPALSSARSPPMRWYQDLFTVWIDIEPGADVADYYLRWTLNRIQFSTVVSGKYYHADLVLCGTIFPDSLTHSKKGLTIAISFRKASSGWMWPRLLRSHIQPKTLKHDAANEIGASDSDSDMDDERLYERAYKPGTATKKRPNTVSLEEPVLDAALSAEDDYSDDERMKFMDDQLFGIMYGNGVKQSP